MPRRFTLALLSLVTLLFPIFFVTPVYAEADLDTMLGEFCDKRSGNQMNLETWYSGKCQDESMLGDGVGFSDIVILDLAERIVGKSEGKKDDATKVKELIDSLEPLINDSEISYEDKQKAVENARLSYFSSQNQGLVGSVTKLISAVMTTRPASTASYVSYLSNNLKNHHIIPETYAAPTSPTVTGAGFSTLSVFIPIWKITRNLAYMLMVLVFVAYGFMMMFRVNLGQKTVITVQLAIPKLIVTFLLITFSFAIVGLILDFMWVIFWFVYYYLGSANADYLISTKNWLVWGVSGRGGMLVSWLFSSLSATIASPYIVTNILLGASTVIGTIGGLVGAIFLGGWLIGIIIFIAVLISYVKLFGKLITSFVSLLVSLILGPLILLGNVFPGSNATGNWIRGVVANVSVFPVTMILLLFSYILMIQPIVSLCDTNILTGFKWPSENNYNTCEWVFGVKTLAPPGSFINTIPLITPILGEFGAGFEASALLALIGVALLLMSSKYVDMVKDALKVPPFKYGSAIAEALKEGYAKTANWARNDWNGIPDGAIKNKMQDTFHAKGKDHMEFTPNDKIGKKFEAPNKF